MASKDLVIASTAVTVRDYPPLPGQDRDRDTLLIRAATRAGEAKRAMSRAIHDLRYRPPRRRTAKVLVLIPAHNEEATIGKTLHALLTQTRVPDRIVVIADNCTDETEKIARRYRGVTVMRTVGNTDRKVGALNQALAPLAGRIRLHRGRRRRHRARPGLPSAPGGGLPRRRARAASWPSTRSTSASARRARPGC